jgi:DNA-binding phage protein
MAAKTGNHAFLLAQFQRLVAQQQTNPYQIAKATGISIPSIRKLLKADYNPAIANIELILHGLGYRITLVRDGEPTIEPGTGRGHGVPRGKRRGKG